MQEINIKNYTYTLMIHTQIYYILYNMNIKLVINI